MAFRADEEKMKGYEKALNYLIPKDESSNLKYRAKAKEQVIQLLEKYGPVVESYPSWHPLVSSSKSFDTTPSTSNGYKRLDHTIWLAHGFITCPYGDADEVIEAVNSRPSHHKADVYAERLEISLYHSSTETVFVRCEWHDHLALDGTIPKRLAVGLMLEHEIPNWRSSDVAETWESMQSYFLGSPRGARSSLFVSQETGQAMKTAWNAIIKTGIFGPIHV